VWHSTLCTHPVTVISCIAYTPSCFTHIHICHYLAGKHLKWPVLCLLSLESCLQCWSQSSSGVTKGCYGATLSPWWESHSLYSRIQALQINIYIYGIAVLFLFYQLNLSQTITGISFTSRCVRFQDKEDSRDNCVLKAQYQVGMNYIYIVVRWYHEPKANGPAAGSELSSQSLAVLILDSFSTGIFVKFY